MNVILERAEKFSDNIIIKDPRYQQRKRRGKSAIIAIAGVSIIVGSIIGVASLISFYAQLNVDIDVRDVILVDDQTQPLISDQFSCYPGNTTNFTHSIENLHPALTYKLNLTKLSIDEGLEVTFIVDGSIAKNVTVPPSTTKDFKISYYVVPNADPDDNLTASVKVEYLDAVKP